MLCQKCHHFLIDPVATFCGHTFCRLCAIDSIREIQNCHICKCILFPGDLFPIFVCHKIVAKLAQKFNFAYKKIFDRKTAAVKKWKIEFRQQNWKKGSQAELLTEDNRWVVCSVVGVKIDGQRHKILTLLFTENEEEKTVNLCANSKRLLPVHTILEKKIEEIENDEIYQTGIFLEENQVEKLRIKFHEKEQYLSAKTTKISPFYGKV